MSRKTAVLLASLLLTTLIMGLLAAIASAVTTHAKERVAQPHFDGLTNPEMKLVVATNFFARFFVFVIPAVFIAVAVSLSALVRFCGPRPGERPGGT
ncbi:MAG: hypothetical protein L6R30_14485 [Thermoanaerobaculia bacterium]|nr:hypothetical protein [Thermoanaerobaculia bacterium]